MIHSEYPAGKSRIITPSSQSRISGYFHILFVFILLNTWLAACSQPVSPITTVPQTISPSPTIRYTPLPTVTDNPTPTKVAAPTITSTATRQPIKTPLAPDLTVFNTKKLREGIVPQAYLDDQCSYLRMRWSPEGSMPGTVVVPIMFHSIIEDGSPIADPSRDISVSQFMGFVEYAKLRGFRTITTRQFHDFLLSNARIPPRSMILIIDDRRPGTIRDRFMPVLRELHWSVTAAYIADPFDMFSAWKLMDQLYTTGRVDVQSHGYTGTVYITPGTTLEQIQNEIWNSTAVLEEHFGDRPIAFIWPGGNFTPESIQVARQGGYELGFTAYSRGPVMFNWIPLGEKEREVDDPLMVLPRAWSSAANINLDEAVIISKQAAQYADQNFQAEANWFRTYCGGVLENSW